VEKETSMTLRRAAITLALVAVGATAVASERRNGKSEVPKAVLDAVAAKHPRSKLIGFSEEREGGKAVYEVTLETVSGRLEAIVSPEGRILTEEQTIAIKDLPEPVRKGLAGSRHAKARVLRVERVTDSRKPKQPTYEILLEATGKAQRHELVFSSAGKLIKDEAKSKHDKD
jgi:hypothetical protein